ncbi:uncharacterized protein LOC103574677 [Microplitis demolitor]|uniref:uncharacterized protein LOC103574677 n=1 Tax=Microplitis demolitor TaxID=69319 RepID=UPI00043FFFF0|nr:uncharacterized protein LOC103574677 [Microplitis demolitor]
MKILTPTLILILIYFDCVSGLLRIPDSIIPLCFQFTWPGPRYDNTTEIKIDCNKKSEPCFKPMVATPDSTPPNITDMWNNFENRTLITCPMRNGFVCVKYSWIYNRAVLNASYFCGKIIEDKTIAIEYGCYTQKKDGHTIEVCACKSNGGQRPCNLSPSINNLIFKPITALSLLLLWLTSSY